MTTGNSSHTVSYGSNLWVPWPWLHMAEIMPSQWQLSNPKAFRKKSHKTIHWLPGVHSNSFPIPKCINRHVWPWFSFRVYSEDVCSWLNISHTDWDNAMVLKGTESDHLKTGSTSRSQNLLPPITLQPDRTLPAGVLLFGELFSPDPRGCSKLTLVSGELIGLKIYQSGKQPEGSNRLSCHFSVYLWSLSVELVGHKVTWRGCRDLHCEDLCSSLLMRECGWCLAKIVQNLVFRRMAREKRFSHTTTPSNDVFFCYLIVPWRHWNCVTWPKLACMWAALHSVDGNDYI